MTRDEIANQIMNATFTERRFAAGYEQRAVDDLLDQLRETVLRGDPVADVRERVDAAVFASRRGAYDQAEVDTFLDRIVLHYTDAALGESTGSIRRSEAGRRPDSSSGPSALPSLPSRPSAPPSSSETPNSPLSRSGGSALIEPRPGLLTRLGRKLRKA